MDIKKILKLKQPSKIRSELEEQILAIIELMGEDTKRYRYWCGRTKHLSPQGIYLMLKEARNGRNPQALFQWLLKQSKTK